MQNIDPCCEQKPRHDNFGLVVVVVLYILLAIILSSFTNCL